MDRFFSFGFAQGSALRGSAERLIMQSPLFVALVLVLAATANAKYIPDPIVRYKIDARLDAPAKTVKGSETIVWKNHTQDMIPDLQFHLYLNAFKNNYSTFLRESGGAGRGATGATEEARPRDWGYEQVHRMVVDGQDLTGKMEYIQPDDGNPYDQTVMRVVLPKPIAPGQSVTIQIDWTSKMPTIFSRTGYRDNFFMVVQWFPKPGVYEAAGERHRTKGGWNTHQFHAATEFYADYGTFDVNLTVPSDFEIGATGTQRSARQNADGTTTYNFYQEDVHDFAWTTQPKAQMMKVVRTFKADEQTTPAEIAEWSRKTGAPPEEVKLQDVQVTLLIQREHRKQIDRHFKAVFAAIKWFGLMYGRYPYDVLTLVDPGDRGAGGMEYPTLITAGTNFWPAQWAHSPEGVIVHEFGHQFWYGLVGNNEFEEAWLDEGFNSYSTTKVLEQAYPPAQSYKYLFGVPVAAITWVDLPVPRYPWHGVGGVGMGAYWDWVPLSQMYARSGRGYWMEAQTDAMAQPSWKTFNRASYGVQAYAKPEITLRTLDELLGEVWPRVIRTYHQRWRFKHPDALDFLQVVNEVSGRDMKWFFDQTLYGTGMLNYSVSFTTGERPAKKGLFDADGEPRYQEERGKGREIESEVVVRRLGEMQFPVTVRVKFEDGSEEREHWDGLYRWTKFKYTGRPKIVLAEVDPDYQWKLEVHRTDDSYLQAPVKLAAEKWYLRWVVWIQNALMGFSYFG